MRLWNEDLIDPNENIVEKIYTIKLHKLSKQKRIGRSSVFFT